MAYRSGRHFLQIPGPSNVPDSVLQAMAQPTIDHRSADFQALLDRILAALQPVFDSSRVLIFPGSGTGAWEAAIVNCLQPGETVLMFETGHFAGAWRNMAERFGLDIRVVPGDWRSGVDPARVEEQLQADPAHHIKAVMLVHNETSTGVTSAIPPVRAAIDACGHPALLMVDTISSLGSMEYRHTDWGVDVTVGGSQKGLMLPPGLAFNAVSDKALAKAAHGGMARSYWHWQSMLDANQRGFTPYTPATNLLFGLDKALELLHAEGLSRVQSRHARHAAACRRAVEHWGLEILCRNPSEYSSTLTAVCMPDGYDADTLRRSILDRFDLSLGTGLGRLAGRVFRIGHLGALNDLMLAATLAGVEMGLRTEAVPHQPGGVQAAMEFLADTAGTGQ